MIEEIPEVVPDLATDPDLMEQSSNCLLTMVNDESHFQNSLLRLFDIFANNIDPSACFTSK